MVLGSNSLHHNHRSNSPRLVHQNHVRPANQHSRSTRAQSQKWKAEGRWGHAYRPLEVFTHHRQCWLLGALKHVQSRCPAQGFGEHARVHQQLQDGAEWLQWACQVGTDTQTRWDRVPAAGLQREHPVECAFSIVDVWWRSWRDIRSMIDFNWLETD